MLGRFAENNCYESPLPFECEIFSPGHECRMPDESRAESPSPCKAPLVSDLFTSGEMAVDYLLWQVSQLPFEERLDCIGNRLLGTTYTFDPLGEGEHDFIDPDPVYSFETLDCLTYVEEVMALSSGTRDFGSFIEKLGEIRYLGGQHLYGMRKHFVSADWLPENERAGIVQDITQRIGGDSLEYVSLTIDRGSWMKSKEMGSIEKNVAMEDLHSIDKADPEYVVTHYIPLSALYSKEGNDFVANDNVVNSLPDISIALLVRPQRYAEKYGTIVAHMGFLVFADGEDGSRGEIMFRHGSPRSGIVTEEPFLPYIDSQKRYRAGVVILEMLD